MSAYYNEIDPPCCKWLMELQNAQAISPGEIDGRDVREVRPADTVTAKRCHFFAGIGGWDAALQIADWPASRPVWTASLPCQPFSSAGPGRGEDDERHLWPVFRDLVGKCLPAIIFGEQVASKSGRAWLSAVFADLEGMGYAVAGADLCAAGVGAPHIRQRLYWTAIRPERESTGERDPTGGACRGLAYSNGVGQHRPGATREGGRNEPTDLLGVGGMVDTDRAGPQGQRDRAEQEKRNLFRRTSGAGGMGDPSSIRRERLLEGGGRSRESLSRESNHGAQRWPPVESARASHWDDVQYIPCRDGKARPIPQSGICPLVARISRGMVHRGDPGLSSEVTAEARAMRIKGYGNSIVPQVAAVFVKTVMEVTG